MRIKLWTELSTKGLEYISIFYHDMNAIGIPQALTTSKDKNITRKLIISMVCSTYWRF